MRHMVIHCIATFLLNKVEHADLIKKIEKEISDFALEKFGAGKVPKVSQRNIILT